MMCSHWVIIVQADKVNCYMQKRTNLEVLGQSLAAPAVLQLHQQRLQPPLQPLGRTEAEEVVGRHLCMCVVESNCRRMTGGLIGVTEV